MPSYNSGYCFNSHCILIESSCIALMNVEIGTVIVCDVLSLDSGWEDHRLSYRSLNHLACVDDWGFLDGKD
jgi:hypothetical protein